MPKRKYRRPGGYGKYRSRRLIRKIFALIALAALIFLAAAGNGLIPPSVMKTVPPWIRSFISGAPALPDNAPDFIDFGDIPEYSGRPYTDVNGDLPFFASYDLTTDAFEDYGKLDSLGRASSVMVCAGPETLPREERQRISEVRPSGWRVISDENIDGGFVYNRCHLIGYQLTGQNANERNLITGTRYMNTEGMKPFEDSIGQYIRGTGNHVLYRVTPDFRGSDALARGVLMEARSVEDPEISFCVYCYNVQPGYEIDYRTGAAWK